jgi:hypothetical protein
MAAPSQEQLLTHIDAAYTFFEQVAGLGLRPTDEQIQELLMIAGVYVPVERINVNRQLT